MLVALATDLANEWSFSCMCSHVADKMMRLPKRHFALRAGEWLFAGMDTNMSGEATFADELLAADFALVRLLTRVDSIVFCNTRFASEQFVTDSTLKASFVT